MLGLVGMVWRREGRLRGARNATFRVGSGRTRLKF